MPCYYTGSAEGDAQLEAEIARKKLTEVTAMLCELCDFVESEERNLPDHIAAWWDEHTKVDRERRRRERRELYLLRKAQLQQQMEDLDQEFSDVI